MGLFEPAWKTRNIKMLNRAVKSLEKMYYYTDTKGSELYKVIEEAPLPEVRMAAYDRLCEILGANDAPLWGLTHDPIAKVRMHCTELCREDELLLALYDRDLDVRRKAKARREALRLGLPEGYDVEHPDKYLWEGKLRDTPRGTRLKAEKAAKEAKEAEEAEKKKEREIKTYSEKNADIFSRLACQTRGDSSPYGKPNVYFSCHPLDFEEVLPSISKDLLDHSNCAVWYDTELASRQNAADGDGNPVSPKDLEDILKEMQLMVFAVSSHFLDQKDPTNELELSLALKHRIPVLPIMLENGLATKFGNSYSKIQVVSKHVSDPTATPYHQVLASFLGSVLVKDELAGKIRSAFDTRLFLSYRKKDREHAQRLMRLLHANRLLWDTAIWYDEFLIPGERYHEAIEEALDAADLFLLAVTPNLLEPKNYVMEIEYPAAVKKEKLIVPVELVPTDHKLLNENYPGLPLCRIEKDADTAVLENLSGTASEKENRSEHDFLIGLAYLYGIDVEVNYDRAGQLIGEAAESGRVEACEKLADMYYFGQGVEPDPQKAILWQKKVVELRQQEYESLRRTIKENQAGKTLFDALWKLGDYCLEFGEYADARTAYEAMPQLAMNLGRRMDLSNSYGKLAVLFRNEGNLTEAKEYYLKAVKIFNNRDPELNTPEARRNLFVSYLYLAQILEEEGDTAAAQEYAEKAHSYYSSAAKNGTTDARRDLAISYATKGRISRDGGKLDEARRSFETAISMEEEIASETKKAEDLLNLAASHENLGELYRRKGDLKNARLHLEKALNLAESVNRSDTARNIGICRLKLGYIDQMEKNFAAARNHFEKAKATFEMLVKKNNTAEAASDLATGYEMLGNLCMDEKDYPTALRWYEKQLKISQEQATKANTALNREFLAISYEKMRDVHRALGNTQEANSCHKKMTDLRRK